MEELLRKKLCPVCKDGLIFNKEDDYYHCECGYVIDEADYDYYVTLAELQDDYDFHDNEEDNQSELNNLEI